MEAFYVVVVIFLLCLAVFDMFVGVSNDAVNFLTSAVGSKAAKFRTILIIAAVGILIGTATSSGMMDIARHGVLQPERYYFNEIMCIYLAVVCTDVMVLDTFNSLGMPTSTTVSMVFELFGGATAMAIIKLMNDASGQLSYANLINTEKVLSVIMAIFVSVAIAFIVGLIVMWISRLVFTFHYEKHMKWTIGIFGGISITSIAFFLITKGFGQASFMTHDIKQWISDNNMSLMLWCFIGFTVLTQILSFFKVNVFKVIVLFGTFSLAMAFAGNDLVNFIGVALAGLSSAQDFWANGDQNYSSYLMTSLAESARTPVWYLIAAGIIMIISLFLSKKAHKVINTSINLSKQNEGDEIFSSSRIARRIVRQTGSTTNACLYIVPRNIKNWVNLRFDNSNPDPKSEELAFDLVRASVNLVLSGLLIVIGTTLKLPLSTTYVAFMVAMGSSLADRAWGRESAVYRITGVMSVIGGWFITAGAAFLTCFVITSVMFYGGPVVMGLIVALVIIILIRSNLKYKSKEEDTNDVLFRNMMKSQDKQEVLSLLEQHIQLAHSRVLEYTRNCFYEITDGLINENVKQLRKASNAINDEKDIWLKARQKEIAGMRRIDYYKAVQKNTWFHLGNNSITQLIYCLKRISDPCLEHVENYFNPLPKEFIHEYLPIRDEVVEMFDKAIEIISNRDYAQIDALLTEGNAMKSRLSTVRHMEQNKHSDEKANIRIELLYQNTLQETQELVSCLRHLLRATKRFHTSTE